MAPARPSTSACAPGAASSWPSCGPRSRCSCASPGSTTTRTTTRSRSSTTSFAAPSGSSPGTAATCCSSRSGDKGAYLYAVFGSPLAHEDDAARACAAALELRELERATRGAGAPGRDRARTAPQRHLRPRDAADVRLPRRRGEPRGAADVQGARRDRSTSPKRCATQAGDAFVWERLPDMTVKGKAEPIAVYVADRGGASRARDAGRGTSSRSSGAARSSRRSRAALARAREGERLRRSASPPRRAWASRGSSRSSCGGPPARRRRRVRRVPGLRHEHELLRLARDLAAPAAASTTTLRRRSSVLAARGRARGDRSGARRAGAAARRRCSASRSPTTS